jgi:hypothetical protein
MGSSEGTKRDVYPGKASHHLEASLAWRPSNRRCKALDLPTVYRICIVAFGNSVANSQFETISIELTDAQKGFFELEIGDSRFEKFSATCAKIHAILNLLSNLRTVASATYSSHTTIPRLDVRARSRAYLRFAWPRNTLPYIFLPATGRCWLPNRWQARFKIGRRRRGATKFHRLGKIWRLTCVAAVKGQASPVPILPTQVLERVVLRVVLDSCMLKEAGIGPVIGDAPPRQSPL